MGVAIFLTFGFGVVIFGLGFVFLTLRHHHRVDKANQARKAQSQIS